ncbi:neprosin family prolyl endopeptidase [Methylomonas sp. AM2-LC]|uniref:neprosin family prolyl endopeptidase n=1 Tax=Methylomonas sp. AM2-LC TaxID=3153301 RepID=UPI0032652910
MLKNFRNTNVILGALLGSMVYMPSNAYAGQVPFGPVYTPIDSSATVNNSTIAIPGNNIGDAKNNAKASNPTVVRMTDPVEIGRANHYLKHRHDRSDIRQSLKTASGRIIDCVDVNSQPAVVNNPSLAGSPIPLAPHIAQPKAHVTPAASIVEPLLDNEGVHVAGCQDGTVPILQVTASDLSRFATLDDFFAKVPSHIGKAALLPKAGIQPPYHWGPSSQHQYAHAYRNVTNWGASSTINVWNPSTELNSEFSLSQIWVVGGSGAGLQTLEVGTQKYRDLYGDYNPHLFIYSTNGGYASGTGCYNNTCGDFVQVSSTIYPGATLASSTYNGTQYEYTMQWFKDMDGGAWWLNVQGTWVGYYPRARYSTAGVANRAAEIDFGGEIIDNRNLGLHTSTDMGSGQFPSAWWQKAAYQRLIKYNYTTTTNPNTVWNTPATGLTATRSDAACYDISGPYYGDPTWGSYFFFGGPGYDWNNCH